MLSKADLAVWARRRASAARLLAAAAACSAAWATEASWSILAWVAAIAVLRAEVSMPTELSWIALERSTCAFSPLVMLLSTLGIGGRVVVVGGVGGGGW